MPQKPLNRSLDANLAFLDEMFGHSDDFYTKRLMIAGIPCAAIMFTGLSSPEKLCRMALDMLDRDPAIRPDEGRRFCSNPVTGGIGRFAPHQPPAGGSFPPKGKPL